MNNIMKELFILPLVVMLFILSDSIYTVRQAQYGVVFQFGEAIKTITSPGLNFKLPIIQQIKYFDKRILSVEVEAKELTASDGKRVIVDSFAKFKIEDPIEFYKKVTDYSGFSIRLNKILESSMRKVIGKLSLTSLLSKERSDIMKSIENLLNEEAGFFGVKVIDVRILRADLPTENALAIYKRMRAEREKEAKQIRAEGIEEAIKIRSTADKESQIILAEAYMQSQALKAEGDAEAARIYNLVYSKDPGFYKFYKSLETYKNTLGANDTKFIISSESQLLQYLNINK